MQKIHFIGIGGIGVSALARYFLSQGFRVSGSDLADSDLIQELRDEGITIAISERAGNVPTDASLVIYSPAIPRDHAELRAAREYGMEVKSYPQALGELTKQYVTIAISGSHGKSTTTSLVALLLTAAKLDPTVIVGTKLREFAGKNFRAGESEYLVVEADEWNRSFHNYFPKIIVLTNIDKEHLDTYKTYAGVLQGFREYVRQLPDDGVLIANWGDAATRKIGLEVARRRNARVVWYNRGRFQHHPLRILGVHNQVNAEGAWQAFRVIANNANITQNNAKKIADKVFSTFTGAWRRMEKLKIKNWKLKIGKPEVYSDYGHHPTEVRVTLHALRANHPKQKLVCIFQPHQRDRLSRLFKDFIHAFDAADMVILLPLYAVHGREHAISKNEKDSFALAQEIQRHKQHSFYAEDIPRAMKIVKRLEEKNVVVVCMGAGSIDAEAREFLGVR